MVLAENSLVVGDRRWFLYFCLFMAILIDVQSFCCDQPPPYTGCDWYYHGGNFLGQIPFQCTGTCPAGKAVIATDPSGCWSGVFNGISIM
jgi:hypothetical protein